MHSLFLLSGTSFSTDKQWCIFDAVGGIRGYTESERKVRCIICRCSFCMGWHFDGNQNNLVLKSQGWSLKGSDYHPQLLIKSIIGFGDISILAINNPSERYKAPLYIQKNILSNKWNTRLVYSYYIWISNIRNISIKSDLKWCIPLSSSLILNLFS